jgi:hypothetical protein
LLPVCFRYRGLPSRCGGSRESLARLRRGAVGTRSPPTTIPTQLARQQIDALRAKAKASFIVAVDDIRRRGCAAAGVRLTGQGLSAICRLSLYGEWRLLTVFEAADRCILLLVAAVGTDPNR